MPSIKLDHPYAPNSALDRELQLPDLDSFEFGQLPELESLDQSTVSLDTPPREDEEDLWKIALKLGPANKDIKFFSWEVFEGPGHVDPPTSYITESGPEILDAALANDDRKIAAGRIVKGNIIFHSLWNLGLGRSSILFSWDAKRRTFVPALQDERAPGLSLSAAKSLVNYFIVTGNTFLYLQSFVERTFASVTSIPARVALATSIQTILSTFEAHLGKHSNAIRSFIQLQHLFNKPREVLIHVARIVDTVKSAKTNEQLSSILHHRVLELEEGNEALRRLSIEILCQVSKPSIQLLSEWIGIQKEQDTVPIADRGSFVVVVDDVESQAPPEYAYNADAMPSFVMPEDGHTIFETGNSLRFLTLHHPEHPLAAFEKFGIRPPKLEWKTNWQDIETLSARAKVFENDLRKAVLEFGNGESIKTGQLQPPQADTTLEEFPNLFTSEGDPAKYLEDSVKLFDQAPDQTLNATPDELQTLITHILLHSSATEPAQSFSPPISLTSTLSFRPLLNAQAKLVNATTMRLFFRSHQLRLHLSLQRQYHLLGDGVFSSRLSSALFDPERETAERKKGTMRSGVHMGLQLGSRSTWPPASSELRLALMGVLNESYYSSALYLSTTEKGNESEDLLNRNDRDELPGQLNFAIRHLTEPEMEKIMDPDSLYALDFLRLQYIPPSPLNLVISSTALEKYDYVFKFLLRLLRILFVVSHLPRFYPDAESRYFRMEAHHFVTALSMYIFQTGIAEHWEVFESYITTVESRLTEEDAAGELGTRVTSGLESLRSAHEQCLDGIMFSLLLRRRQKKVMTLLEEVFNNILLFAKMQNEGSEIKESVKELYAKLRGKIKVFISVCRGLTGKKGYGNGRGTGEENTIERLCLLLEMNGYYSR